MKSQYLLLFKKQVTVGAPETLLGTEAIETVDGVQIGEYEGEFSKRNVDGVIVSPGEEVNTKPHQTLTTKIDMAGCGSNANEVAYGPMLEGCGFTRTTVTTDGSEQEIFTLNNTTDSALLTLGRHVGDQKYNLMADVRGNVEFSFDSYLRMMFNFIGSYNRPVEKTNPVSITYSNYATPIPVNYDNTTACKLDGVDVVVHSLSIKAGSGVNMVNVPGQKEARHSALFATANLTMPASKVSDKDWFVQFESHQGVAKVSFEITHGTVQYNTIKFSCSTVQVTKPKETSIDGDEGYQVELGFFDALVITFT
ncbi:MAG: hypothetical protein HRT38_02730 [Alteromonadaceae bacterium]|nr:hypothetical protein [Alteromonadaceae bacterium]